MTTQNAATVVTKQASQGGAAKPGSPVSPQASVSKEGLLTFTPQPEGLFEKNDLKVDSIAFSKYFICVRGLDPQGLNAVRVYNQSGTCLHQYTEWRGAEVNTFLQEGYNGHNPEFHKIKGMFAKTRVGLFPPSECTEALNKLHREYASHGAVRLEGSDYVTPNMWVNNRFASTALLKPPTSFYSEPSGRYITFRGAVGSIGVYDTQTDTGEALQPDKWVVREWNNLSALQKDVKNFPFLAGFASTVDGHPLPGGEHLASYRPGLLTVVRAKDLQRVLSDACNGYACDPINPSKLLYVNSNTRQFSWVDLSKTTPTSASVESTPLPFTGNVADLKLDPIGNFILCTVQSEDKNSSKLVVLDKVSMQVVAEHPDVWGAMTVDSVGTIYYVDQNQRFRVVNTNLASIPAGGFAAYEQQVRERAAKKLKAASEVVLPKLPEGVTVAANSDTATIEDAIPKTLLARFGEAIEKTKTVAELEKLEAQFGLLRTSEEFADSPAAFSLIDEAVSGKRNALVAHEISADLDKLLAECSASGAKMTPKALKLLDTTLAEIRKQRGQIAIDDPAQREAFDKKLAAVTAARTTAYDTMRGTISNEIDSLAKSLTNTIAAARSLDEIYAVLTTEDYALYGELVKSIEDKAERARCRDLITTATQARTAALEGEASAHAQKEAELAQESAEQAAQMLEQLKAVAGRISSPAELKKFQTSPLLAAFSKMTLGLSDADQTTAQASVASLLQQAGARASAQAGLKKIKATGGQITIGKQSFMIAGEYSPVVQRVTEGDGVKLEPGQLMFKDGFGRTYTSAISCAGMAIDSEAYTQACKKAFTEAVTHFKSQGRKVPEMRPTWRMTKHTEECLEKIIRELNIQRESGQGILILEGEAGTGKNVLIDILASMAGYERFMFACNSQTQKEDFTYEYTFSPEKGTHRVDAKLIEKLQTPYVIIALDEINTLPPGVLKMLNAPLDEKRTLFLVDGRELRMDPTSLLVGFMNPRNYVGTQELSREVVSRASIVTIGYPPLKRKDSGGVEKFAPDEATMLACCVPGLAQFSQQDFEAIWDSEINKTGKATAQVTNDQRRLIQGLHKVIKVANAVRQQYTAYQTNVGTQQMDFVFCLRTTTSIARRLTPDVDPLEVIKEVVLPKASDPETRKNLELIVANT